ncbi:hypothetical protein BpHYR1_031824 [Brachionus plicatilis]|uniref:Uncharacterized protein n=1 Tax=Brachionus plicatilis TaxID=10195 RepID=A0A3M7SYA4_BRAPC|nr:hypothetical protein BpHYR1_031824 [Brachionus plicatilis]
MLLMLNQNQSDTIKLIFMRPRKIFLIISFLNHHLTLFLKLGEQIKLENKIYSYLFNHSSPDRLDPINFLFFETVAYLVSGSKLVLSFGDFILRQDLLKIGRYLFIFLCRTDLHMKQTTKTNN